MPRINFADVKGLEPLPPGHYVLEVVHAEEGVSKEGNEKIALRYKVVKGEYEGRQMFDNLTFVEDSLWRVKQFLLAIGYPSDYDDEVSAEELVGTHFEADVVIQKGKINPETGDPYPDRNGCKRYYAVGELSVEDLV